ncbi:MAG: thiamine ABC transporter substrate-binding protein [Microthrixaceae bacterium]
MKITGSERNSPRRPLAAVAALVLLTVTGLLVTACSSGSNSAEDSATSGSEQEQVLLVTYDAFALPKEAAAEFKKLTGATIKVVATGDTGTMLTKALLSAGSPEGDVIFGIDNTLATRALEEKLLVPFQPESINKVPESLRLQGAAGELLVPIDTADVCINVDEEWFAKNGIEPPSTMAQLTDPAYKDLLVVESPVTSSPGLAFLIGTIARSGDQGWPDYWKQLKANGVRVRPSWDDAFYTDYTVSGGDRPLVLSYASSPPAEVVFSEGKRTEPASAVMLDSCVAQIEYAGVLAGAAEPELAQQLVEFMLSPAWQQALPLSNYVFPATDVALPDVFAKFAPRAANPLSIEPAVIAAQREAWIEQWREIME